MAGFTSVSSMIRNELADPIGVDQVIRKNRQTEFSNELARMAAETDQVNASQFQRQNDLQAQRQQMQIDAAKREEYRQTGLSVLGWLDQNQGKPEYAQMLQQLAADPESQQAAGALGIDLTKLNDPAYRAVANAKLRAPVPEAPQPLAVQNVGGFRVLTQGDRVLPGGVQAPMREATGGAPGGRFGAPREGVNPETGNVEFFVTDNAGNVRWLGASGAAGKNTEARETAKDVVDARADVGRVTANARDMLNVLGQLERSQLGLIFGAASVAPTIPGTRQADTIALWEQVNGKAFLEAFNSLKGGGQITEKEGEKATAAITRLSNRKQSPKAAREAIRELREVVTAGVVRARRKAEGGQQAAPSGNVVNFEDL